MKYEAKLVNLTKKQMAVLRNISKRRGVSVSYLIRQAINRLTLEDVLSMKEPIE
jgi:hypothetical protein